MRRHRPHLPSRAWVRPVVAATAATATALSLAACGGTDTDVAAEGDGDAAAFTLYSGRDEELIGPLVEAYQEETGVQIDVRYGNSAEMAAQLLEEGEGTPADVFYSQEVGAIGALDKAGLLGALPSEVVELADDRFQPDEGSDWVGVTGRSRVIVYDPEVVTDPPEGVLDLTDPQYAGQVGWIPGNAGFQAFVTGFRVQEGEDAAARWLQQVEAGDPTVFESNGDLLDAVEAGNQPIGLINHYYWARLAPEVGGVENLRSRLVFPEGDDPGGLVNATAVGVTERGETNQAAQDFVAYLLSEEGQQLFVDETYEYPVVDGVADPEGVPPLEDLEGPELDLADLDSLEETQALLTREGLLS